MVRRSGGGQADPEARAASYMAARGPREGARLSGVYELGGLGPRASLSSESKRVGLHGRPHKTALWGREAPGQLVRCGHHGRNPYAPLLGLRRGSAGLLASAQVGYWTHPAPICHPPPHTHALPAGKLWSWLSVHVCTL
jgi:hypothetical protein